MTEESERPELRELEDRLRGMPPAPLREAFRERLLARTPNRQRRVGLWLAAAAVLLCAATVTWVLVRPEPKPTQIVTPRPEEGTPTVAWAESPPTWLAYAQAAADSPEELDQLLSAHERQLLPAVPALEKNFPL